MVLGGGCIYSFGNETDLPLVVGIGLGRADTHEGNAVERCESTTPCSPLGPSAAVGTWNGPLVVCWLPVTLPLQFVRAVGMSQSFTEDVVRDACEAGLEAGHG
jgi:hypothetical protein